MLIRVPSNVIAYQGQSNIKLNLGSNLFHDPGDIVTTFFVGCHSNSQNVALLSTDEDERIDVNNILNLKIEPKFIGKCDVTLLGIDTVSQVAVGRFELNVKK